MRRRCSCLILILFVLAAGLWLAYWRASGIAERKIEQEVTARLPAAIGAGGQYKVTASAGLLGLARGQVGSVKIESRNVILSLSKGKLKSGIKLKQLDTVLTGIHINPADRTVTKIDRADFTASITGEELNSLIARKYPDIPGKAVLHDGYVTVAARPRIHGIKVRVETEAALEIEGGAKLVLRVRKVSSGLITVPEAARNYIEQKLNPVLDLSQHGFRGRLTSVTIKPDAVTLRGTGDPAGLGI